MEGLLNTAIRAVFAQTPEVDKVVGSVTNPLNAYGGVKAGFTPFVSNVLRFVFVAAGLIAFFNFVLAGFKYMTAAGDSKKLTSAFAQIWQSLVGLIIIVSSFVIAVLVGALFFDNPMFILKPVIYGPK